MRIIKKAASALFLLFLIETLYLTLDISSGSDFSFGLPFRSVKYRPDSGHMGPLSEEEWASGFKIDSHLFVIEILVALFLILLLVKCVPSSLLILMVQGYVLGILTGGLFFVLTEMLPESWLTVTLLFIVMLVLVPISIYVFSLRHKRQKTVILVISFVTLITFLRSFWVIEGLSDGVMEDFSFNLKVVLRFLVLFGILSADCFLVMLLHRKVLPFLFRKKLSNKLTDTRELNVVQESVGLSVRADMKITIKRAILYTSLLAITIYIGYHFDTIRKMRDEEGWLLLDAIDATLEKLDVSRHSGYSFGYMEQEPESLKGKWNVSIPAEIHVDDEHIYYVLIKKRFLVPWVQVEIDKMKGTTIKNDENRASNEN